jgi:ribonuclease HII
MLYTIGIDEVGRGPIAGPVAVGAFVILRPNDVRVKAIFRGVKESKQISEEKREEWFRKINEARKAKLVDYKVTFVSQGIIDEKGISFSIRSALDKSLNSLVKSIKARPDNCEILLDGGLKAPLKYKKQKTIIRGDAKIQVIALASIVSKVLRDRHMISISKKHKGYGFDKHKGYGTREHYQSISRLGISLIHRKSFLRKLLH